MQLIGKLKKQVDGAGSRAEAKTLIEKAGMLLNDDELSKVAGGGEGEITPFFGDVYCPDCDSKKVKRLTSDPCARVVQYRCDDCGLKFGVYVG